MPRHSFIRAFSSLRNLCVLCASVVSYCCELLTTETQSTQRLHREAMDSELLLLSLSSTTAKEFPLMKQRVTIDGNEAAAYVAYKTNEVIAIYPITPSSA